MWCNYASAITLTELQNCRKVEKAYFVIASMYGCINLNNERSIEMTYFTAALKKDLSLAKLSFLLEGKEKMTVVMGRVVDAVDAADLAMPLEKDLTLVEELQHFRLHLNQNLDWEHRLGIVTDDELDQIRKIVDDLTETDYLTSMAI